MLSIRFRLHPDSFGIHERNRLLYHGQLVRDKEDVEGEIAEDAIEEEII